MGSVLSRIEQIIKNEGITIGAMEKKIGASKGVLSRAIAKGTDIQSKWIENIVENYPQYSTYWLLTGNGNMKKDDNNQVLLKGKAINIPEMYVEIPYISKHATATFVESLYNNDPEYETYPVIPQNGEKINSEDYCIFEIYGDSMIPTVNQGSLVLAKLIKEDKWEYAEGVVIVVYGKSLVIKRIKKNNLFINNTILLCSDNPLRGELLIERSEIRAIYKAKRIISENIL